MLLNKQAISGVFLALKATFNNALKREGDGGWSKLATKIPSTTKQNDYAWLSDFPKMRKWVGEKTLRKLKASSYSIVNDDWEATVVVLRNDIEDDNLGMYTLKAQSAGESARDLPDDIVYDLVNGSFTSTCFDGQYFFDTDHPVFDPATQAEVSVSNKLTVALSAATQAAAIASLGAAKTRMMTFKDDEGRPLNITPDTLLVPPALEDVANILYTNERLEDGKPNPYKGQFKPMVSARLSSSTAWFLLCTTKPIRPFIYQERKAPVTVTQTDPNSDDVFNKAEYKFGVEARAAGGYGLWQLAVGSTGAG